MTKARKKKSSQSPVKKRSIKNKNSSKKAGRRTAKHGHIGKKIFLLLILLLSIGSVLYLWYLNHLIEQRFDGETWARPSRVFARPLELYTGLDLSPQQLIYELKLADYQPVQNVSKPGQFSFNNQTIKLFSREFYFSDHFQREEKIRVQFDDNEITLLENISNSGELQFFQLTPALIGSYIPGNGEDRRVIDIDEIPADLIKALLAVEDRGFYSHLGVRPLSIMRALMANIRAGKTVQGGSTLTQQLAKNMFLTPERSIIRKINEAIMSVMLELRFDKDAILTAYINEVFLLQQNNTAVHGFALASNMLFKQPLKYLSPDKLALLVGMVKGPSIYNPLANPERSMQRRNQVLKVMFNDHQITEKEYRALSKKPLGVVKRLPPVNQFPAYLDLVKQQLKKNYSSADLAEKGLSIFTAFDPVKQQHLEQGLKNGLTRFSNKTIQTAVVMADYLSGDLLAMVGDRHTDFPGYNRAIMAQRPIGSLIKPILLYGLLSHGRTLASLVDDRPIRIKLTNDKIWSPQNYDKELHGEMTLYNAFVNSYNLPFVHLGLENNGLEILTENLEKIQLVRQQVIYPSILLGATVMTPFEVTQMFQVIANSGYFTPLTTIRQVMDNNNEVLTRIPLYSAEVFDRQAMVKVQRALIGVAEEGTARYLKTRFAEKTFAGKTGTTNDLRDSWFAGFSDRYLTVVWLGDDDNNTIDLTGSSGALRVWADIMTKIDDKSIKLTADPNLEWQYINRLTGGKSGKNCENSVLLPFSKGSAPDFSSDCNANYLEKGINWLQQQFQ
jgi:penicillin-binding protein 1B